MTVLIIFTLASLAASVLVVAALMLSSRLSQQEGVEESYETAKPDVVRGPWGELL